MLKEHLKKNKQGSGQKEAQSTNSSPVAYLEIVQRGGHIKEATDNLSARRRGRAGLFNYCVTFFVFCMISLKLLLNISRQQLVLLTGLQNSIFKSHVFRFLKITH